MTPGVNFLSPRLVCVRHRIVTYLVGTWGAGYAQISRHLKRLLQNDGILSFSRFFSFTVNYNLTI